jgi:hypothetical protein
LSRLRSKKLGHSKEPVGWFYRLWSRGASTVGGVGLIVDTEGLIDGVTHGGGDASKTEAA